MPPQGMKFEFEVFGDTLVRRRLRGIQDRAGDVGPAYDAIADLIMGETKEQFDTEGAHAGTPWAPLAASTVALKRQHGLDPRILRAHGDLYRSLTQRGDPDQELIAENEVFVFRSKLPQHRFHQLGTKERGGGQRMPARPPVAFTEDAKRRALEILQTYVVTGRLP